MKIARAKAIRKGLVFMMTNAILSQPPAVQAIRRSRGKIEFPGPLAVQQRRQRALVRVMEQSAEEYEREARRLRECAEKISAEPTRLHNTNFLCRLVNRFPVARQMIAELCGVKPLYRAVSDRDEFTFPSARTLLIDVISYGTNAAVAEYEESGNRISLKYESAGYRSVDLDLVRLAKSRSAPSANPPPQVFDVVAEATKVLVGTASDRIDWSREPVSDRERLVRRKWIEREIRKGNPYVTCIQLRAESKKARLVASDLARALAVMCDVCKDVEQNEQQRNLAEIQREVLFGKATEDEKGGDSAAAAVERIRNIWFPVDPDVIIQRIFGDAQNEAT